MAPPAPSSPPSPAGLLVATSSTSSLSASWASGGGTTAAFIVNIAQGYVPSLSCVSNGTGVPGVFGVSYSFTGLTANTQYTIAVCAYNSYGARSASLVLTGTTASTSEPAAPPSPSNLAVTTSSSSQLAASWTSGGGTTAGYIVNIVTGNIPSLTCVNNGTGVVDGTTPSHNFTGLSANTQYTVAICSYNSYGVQSASAVKTGLTSP